MADKVLDIIGLERYDNEVQSKIKAKQDALVSGINIKTINNTSLLGSGDITISGGGNKYIIEVEGYNANFNETQIDTVNNRTTLQNIYDNYSNIKVADIFFKDTRDALYNIEFISIYNNWMNIVITCGDASSSGYGVSYKSKKAYGLWAKITNDEITSISMSKETVLLVSDASKILGTENTISYTPSGDYNPATKKYVDDKITSYTGYDATKTQVLKNVNGTLTWVDE